MKSRGSGFTIVELLIVIVVIGILAAITIVAFNGVQSRARTSQVNSTLSNYKKAMQAYKVRVGELPPTGDAWNGDTNPPSCPTIVSVVNTLNTEGYSGLSTTDPWGNCWGYDDNDCNSGSAPTAQTSMRSAGPDGTTGTSDDISLQISAGC